jgi:hypothetical protein
MKTFSSIATVLKMVVKYGAIVAVIVKVVQFAVDEFEKIGHSADEPKQLKNEDNDQ